MSIESTCLSRCEQICNFFGIFYRPLPPFEQLEAEFESVRKIESLRREKLVNSLAIHVAMLNENDSQYEVIKNFLKQGKIGKPHRTSISNYPNHYIKDAIDEYSNDLVVIMVPEDGDIFWGEPDKNGHAGGYPAVPYSKETYGSPIANADEKNITHIPPDRIIGFYYIPKTS